MIPPFEPNLCGYRPNPVETERYVGSLPGPELGTSYRHLMGIGDRDAFLWKPMLSLHPTWRRGSQGIGDCVAWGAELCATILMALDATTAGDQTMFRGEAATEAIYGGCRVEAQGGRLGGYEDGSWGSAAAEWLEKWGVLLREDYSTVTGNREHNLITYDGKKAKAWGNFGCGGQQDKRGEGLLDLVAREHPIQDVTRVKTVDELVAALQNGYPVSVASMVGYEGKRNAQGVVRARGQWAHQMMFGGVRWVAGQPQFRQFNSWGKSVEGPDPGIESQAVSDCSWWTTAKDAAKQLRQDDSFAFANFKGFPAQKLDFMEAAKTWDW